MYVYCHSIGKIHATNMFPHLELVFELVHTVVSRHQCFVRLLSQCLSRLLILFVLALQILNACHMRTQRFIQDAQSVLVLACAFDGACCVLLQRLEVALLQKFGDSVCACVCVF